MGPALKNTRTGEHPKRGSVINFNGFRKCIDCGHLLTLDQFYAHSQKPNTTLSRCRTCHKKYCTEQARKRRSENPQAEVRKNRRHRVKRQYGLTWPQYMAMLESQQFACAICRKPFDPSGCGGVHVDHCHATGKIRGLLCLNCNRGLGAFRDEPNLLHAAIDYLAGG